MNKHRFSRPTLVLLLGLLPILAPALPEDRQQEVVVDADHSDLYIDEGIVVHYGSEDAPAVITQGSMRVEGSQITIENSSSNRSEPGKITAVGNPARFQQQPAVDKGIVYARGNTIIYDDEAQLLTLEGAAGFTQDGNTISASHIDYDLEAGRARASSPEGEGRVQMVIPPQEDRP